MADQSKTPEPVYRRGTGTDPKQGQIPYGAATDLNKKSAMAGQQAPPPFPDLTDRGSPEDEPVESLLGGDFDSVLFQPTHRPDEPVTAGAPHGDGPNAVRAPGQTETTKEFLQRVASSLITHPALGSASRNLLARIERGE